MAWNQWVIGVISPLWVELFRTTCNWFGPTLYHQEDFDPNLSFGFPKHIQKHDGLPALPCSWLTYRKKSMYRNTLILKD